MRIDYAIVFVHDMKKSIAFYRDAIGLPLKFETPHWTEFATEGSTLALHAADEPNPDPEPVDDLPAGRCRTGFSVPDLDAFHGRMLRHNVPCLQPPKEQFGARLAQYVDPDGMVISVSQTQRCQ